VAGTQASRFRAATEQERLADLEVIRDSGAALVFVGLGCPRQEIWAFENRVELGLPVVAVGAAFDFFAGNLDRAPAWMQKAGLEWLFRLRQEPRRLWRRYLILNPAYLFRLGMELTGIRRIPTDRQVRPPLPQRPS
jgi:exopolysaccharide biosynthesis WecB/TagA/CpsF family protein